jgi:hypothetical protein
LHEIEKKTRRNQTEMAEIIITGMKIEKNQIVITEAKQVDDDGNPTRKVSINEHFAIALSEKFR